MSRDSKYIGIDVHKEAIVIAVLNGSPHQAPDALTVGVQRKRVNRVFDADIRGSSTT
jgi:hypothetical protein